jgi:serine/threonine protein kinase
MLRRRKRPAVVEVVRMHESASPVLHQPTTTTVTARSQLFFNPAPAEHLEVLGTKGQGGFGAVGVVRDTRSQAIMACKRQPWNAVSRNEYFLYRHLQVHRTHPNVVRLLEARATSSPGNDGPPGKGAAIKRWSLLLFELADMDLLQFLRVHGHDWRSTTVTHRMTLLRDIVCGLRFLHHQGVLHLDLKPANVLVFDAGDSRRRCAKLGDLGSAYLLDPDRTIRELRNPAQACVVTNPYRAPELMFATTEQRTRATLLKLDRAVDVWSLGCLALDLFDVRAFQSSAFVRQVQDAHPKLTGTQVELAAEGLQHQLVSDWLEPIPIIPSHLQLPGLLPMPPLSRLERLVYDHAHIPFEFKALIVSMLARIPGDRPTIQAVAEALGV